MANSHSAGAPTRDAVDHALETASDLNNLVDWISQARQLISEFTKAAEMLPSLKEVCEKYEIRTSAPDWRNDLEGMGLFRVHRQIEECIGVALKRGEAS